MVLYLKKFTFYIIYYIYILLVNFSYSPHYFVYVFYTLKVRIKHYIPNNRYLLRTNYLWLAKLVGSIKPAIPYLATVDQSLIRELPQSCEAISRAIELGLVFCPSAKNAKHDGCFYDPEIGRVIGTIQFKLKEEGARVGCDLFAWSKKYSNLDMLDIGFQSPQDLDRSKDLIIKVNEFLYLKGDKLIVTFKDYSLYQSEHTCRSDLKDILEIHASFNKIVYGVNQNMIDSYGEIITIEPIFFT